MQTQLQSRLSNLKTEFEAGQKKMSDLEMQKASIEQQMTNLHNTLLRISGAVQVLDEELAKSEQVEENQEEAIPVS